MFNAHKGTCRYQSIEDDFHPVIAKKLNTPSEVFARAVAQLAAEEIGKIRDAEGHPLDPELQKKFQGMLKDGDKKFKTWRPTSPSRSSSAWAGYSSTTSR